MAPRPEAGAVPVKPGRATRPLARLVLILGIVLLGAVAAARLRLAFLPSWSFPELTVDLALPESTELSDLTRTWIVPLESAIRAVGDVRGVAGEVHAGGGSLRVRFRAGSDAERKAARLESELAALRRHLVGGSLQVWPVGQGAGDRAAIVWLDASENEKLDRSFLATLRALPEVRSVEVAGEPRREIRLTPHSAQTAGQLSLDAAIGRQLRGERLGEIDLAGRRIPVWIGAAENLPLSEMPIRRGQALVPLRSLARIELYEDDAPRLVHVAGRRGLVLLVAREVDASPLAFERSLRRTLAEHGWSDRFSFLINEAEPLKLLLHRLAAGLVVATLILALAHGIFFGWRAALWHSAALPLALAAALNGFWLAGIPLDVTTLPALTLGLGSALLWLGLRFGGRSRQTLGQAVLMVLSATALPVAVALAGGRLAPLLSAPARAFALTVAAALAVLWLLPEPARSALPPPRLSRPLRAALRHPWAVILGASTLTYLLLVLSGRALEPRAGDLSPTFGDLAVYLRFAQGTTMAQAEAQVVAVERHLDRRPEIETHWSVFDRRGAAVIAQARRQDRKLSRLRFLAPQLEYQFAAVGASARVVPLSGSSSRGDEPVRFSDDLETRAETDEAATSYRFILRHTEVESLRNAHSRAQDRLARLKHDIWRQHIISDWGRPTARLELVPRPGVPIEAAQRVRQALARRSTLPPARPLTAVEDLALRVMGPHTPITDDDVPQRAELLGLHNGDDGEPRVASNVFEVVEVVASPTVKRESGRFVLPVSLRVAGEAEGYRKASRRAIHRGLRDLPMPAGTDVELPELNPALWDRDRLRMVAIASALPLLLLALAIARLSSVSAGLTTLAPMLLALAAAAPWIQATRGHVDEMTLLGLAMALAGTSPLALETAAAARAARAPLLSGGILFRWLAQRAPGIVCFLLPMACLLVLPGLGLDSDRHPWVLPLRAAAATGSVLGLAACFWLPVLLQTARRLRQRDRRVERQKARPPAWQGSKRLAFEVRNVSKIYSNGFQALHAVRFRLEPGIVGLLGPNGAGKTTLLRLLCGLLEPSRGQVRYQGIPLAPVNLPEYRRLVGFLPQGFNAYEGFTGAQFLDYWALQKGFRDPQSRRREVDRVLSEVGLQDAGGRRVRDFSGGMRRRIGIARALLGEPPILIVDEPTTGLDVESRNRLRETLLAVAGERIIIFSTHIASDVAAAAARILLLDRGRLVFDGPSSDLIARAHGRVFEALIEDHDLRDFSNRYRVTTRVRTLHGLRVRAVVYGEQQPAGEIVEPNLEEAYLAMIGAPGRQGEKKKARGGSLLDLEVWDSRKRARVASS